MMRVAIFILTTLFCLVALFRLRFFSAPRSLFATRTEVISLQKSGCDYGRGHWLLDESRRPLYGADCPFQRNAWNCEKNKKPGWERMTQWTWVPRNCTPVRRLEPHSFLRAIRGLRLGFIGDSLNENFMVAFVCSLGVADATARKWKRKRAWRGAYFPSFDVTVGYHRAVLLSKFAKMQGLPGLGSAFRVDIDVPADDWVNSTEFYDALVFNTGHWWGYDKFPEQTPLEFYKQGQPTRPSLSMRGGLAAVLESTLDFIDTRVPARVLKVWRLQSPRHFQFGEWNQNGSCSGAALLNDSQVEEWFGLGREGVNREEREVNRLIESALSRREGFMVLNVAAMSEYRADAHPSVWLGSEHAHKLWGQDCLHWCLPGVPDTWVDMLAALVLDHMQAAR